MQNGKGRHKTLKGVTVKPPASPDETVQTDPAITPNEGARPSRAPLPRTQRVTITNMVAKKSPAAEDREELASQRPSRMKTARALDMKTVSVNPQAHDAWTAERLLKRSTPPPIPPESIEELAQNVTKFHPSVAGREDLRRGSSLSLDPAAGKALDLVERSNSASELRTEPVDEMEELYALGNFSDALRVAELILGRQPNNTQAQRCATNSRQRLEQLYSSKIGPMSQVPIVALRSADLRWLGLDHRAGFVLSRIDGKLTVEELLEICSMPRLEVLKTVIELVNCGAIFLQ